MINKFSRHKCVFYFLFFNLFNTTKNGVISNVKNNAEIKFAYKLNSIGNIKSNKDVKTKNEIKKYIKDKKTFKNKTPFQQILSQ
ncbi:hypothetical protein A9958_01165 [Staphylococcus simulans]|nr:hypothetical protein BI282_01160 [Staphylococcus simulans]OFJ76144.1 hypothetical protein HMPREF2846_12530 [Staphylococcus sp. HMSC056G08]OHR56448.1 hypothetical protein HMPREF2937_09055 [Staphylococcus sp. HMSC061G12]AVO04035.1 hypothetical protein BI283_01160 [Staphylococcus simulans]AWG17631.1 hypothetical protein A9958_01165 [Staphylococcus simulans]